MTDFYSALGVPSSASTADIKTAFRRLAAHYHPDRNASPDAPARFRSVQEAYEVLSNDDKRQAYDNNRRRNLLDDPLQTAQGIWGNYLSRITETP